MKYRILGRTGLKVSELGFGGHEYGRWLPRQRNMEEFIRTQPERNKLILSAVNAGINYFDTTFSEETESLGLALKELGKRDDVYRAVMLFNLFGRMCEKTPSEWRQMIIDDVEEKLRLLHTHYVDILNILAPEDNYSPKRLTAAIEVSKELKEKGMIGFLGASSHQPRFLAELIRRYDCFDTVMVRYNYYLQEARDTVFPLAKALDVGVVVMKPFSWPYYGIPFMRFGPLEKESGPYTPAQLSLRWILDCPEVATTVPAMYTQTELDENLAAIEKEGKLDAKVLDEYLKTALSTQGHEKLKEMSKEPAINISHHAKRTLTEMT